jgi:hypothetical protein
MTPGIFCHWVFSFMWRGQWEFSFLLAHTARFALGQYLGRIYISLTGSSSVSFVCGLIFRMCNFIFINAQCGFFLCRKNRCSFSTNDDRIGLSWFVSVGILPAVFLPTSPYKDSGGGRCVVRDPAPFR